ncbi:MAG TPA: biopolymer transporter ExbD [Bacteroidales bacterium]|nr:biopolymer transporter ExbD [Bacteroidales bacterium]HSA43178.1 biopolymer transporter ExbD [Bacteroidales bacterium]
MNLRKRSAFHAEVYTGSLNDIMFFLLLFFLIISTLVNPSVIKLMLPKATTSQAISKQQISLSVTADKRYFVNNQEIGFDMLESELQRITSTVTEPTVVLRFDNALSVQDLVDVLQIGNKVSIKMVLATKSMQR